VTSLFLTFFDGRAIERGTKDGLLVGETLICSSGLSSSAFRFRALILEDVWWGETIRGEHMLAFEGHHG
jgi:hypothetical protein